MEATTAAGARGFAPTAASTSAAVRATPTFTPETTAAAAAAAAQAVPVSAPVAVDASASTSASTTVAAVPTWADTRMSGSAFHLSGAALSRASGNGRSLVQRLDLFGDLRSALNGLNAQAGLNELVVKQLLIEP